MSPARLETEIYSYLVRYKTAQPKSFAIKEHRTSGLPAEIKSIHASADATVIRLSSFNEYGGVPRDIQTEGDTTIERTVEHVKHQSGCLLANLYVATVTLRGQGSSMSYEIPGGANPANRPNRVTITHIDES